MEHVETGKRHTKPLINIDIKLPLQRIHTGEMQGKFAKILIINVEVGIRTQPAATTPPLANNPFSAIYKPRLLSDNHFIRTQQHQGNNELHSARKRNGSESEVKPGPYGMAGYRHSALPAGITSA